jgi:hypothetical protein
MQPITYFGECAMTETQTTANVGFRELGIAFVNLKERTVAPGVTIEVVRGKHPLANPFRIGHDGDRRTVLKKYKRWLWTRLQQRTPERLAFDALMKRWHELRRRGITLNLACYCHPAPCHTHILAKAMAWQYSQWVGANSEPVNRYRGSQRVAVIGSRDGIPASLIRSMIDDLPMNCVVVSGGARGVDSLAARFASQRGLDVVEFFADWDAHGRSAGFLRNRVMAANADYVLALWNGSSRGTGHMIAEAKSRGIPVKVVKVVRGRVLAEKVIRPAAAAA